MASRPSTRDDYDICGYDFAVNYANMFMGAAFI